MSGTPAESRANQRLRQLRKRYVYRPQDKKNELRPISTAKSWPWLAQQYGPSWLIPFIPGFLSSFLRTQVLKLRFLGQRILFRNHVRYSGDFRIDRAAKQKMQATHRARLAKRYPALADIEFEQTWGGVICMTRDKRAVFDRLAPGVFASIAYNGVGISRGTISGALLAEFAAGGESALIDDARSLAGPPPLPPKPALAMGVNAKLAWIRLRGRGEE